MLFRSQISQNQCFLRFQPLKPSEPFKNLRIFNILTPGVTEALQKPKVFLVLSNWSLQNPSKTKGFSIFWPLGSLGPFKNLRFFRFSVPEAFGTLQKPMILNVLSPNNVLRTLQNPAIFWRSEFWTWKTNTSQGFSTWSLQNLSRSNWFTIFYSLERYFFLGCSFARTIMKSKWSQILRTGLMLDLVLRYAGSDALRITPISSDLISGAVFF